MGRIHSILAGCIILWIITAFSASAEIPPSPQSSQTPTQTSVGNDRDDRMIEPTFVPTYEVPPQVIKDVDPMWPDSARAASISGRVSVQFYVDEDGTVLKAFVLKSKPKGCGFEDAALNAIYAHKFAPAKSNGKPIGVWLIEVFTFKIK